MHFSNGAQVAFCDPRRLGRIKLRTNALMCPPISSLARDPYSEDFDVQYVASALSGTSKPLKALLLEQDSLFSGIGNWLADEILFQSGIHPKSPSNNLKEFAVATLAEKTKSIIFRAVECQSQGVEMPDDWLFHYRWDKGSKGGTKCKMPDGRGIVFETVGGRTSAIVPSVQRLGGPQGEKELIVLQSSSSSKLCDSRDALRRRGRQKIPQEAPQEVVSNRKRKGKTQFSAETSGTTIIIVVVRKKHDDRGLSEATQQRQQQQTHATHDAFSNNI